MLSFPKAWGPARLALQDATDGGTLWAGRSQARRGLVLVGSLAPAAGSLSSGRSLQLRSSPKLPRGGWPAFLTAPRPPQHSWAAGAPLPWFSRSPRAAPPQVLPVGLVSRGVTSTTSLHASAGGGKSASAKSEKQKKKLKDKEMAEKEKAIEAEIKDAKWSGRLEELRLVAAGNGGTAHVSQGDPERPALGTWCNTQRGKERRGKLGAGRKARLLEIGFVFEILEDAWDKSLEELRVVAAGTGGIAHVSRLDTDRPELGTWCLKQRNIEECGEIREDRKDRLLEIGFVFDLYDAAWDQRLKKLRLIAEDNGGKAHVVEGDPVWSVLGRWCTWQGVLERRGELLAGRKARLLEIGFVFPESSEKLRRPTTGVPRS